MCCVLICGSKKFSARSGKGLATTPTPKSVLLPVRIDTTELDMPTAQKSATA